MIKIEIKIGIWMNYIMNVMNIVITMYAMELLLNVYSLQFLEIIARVIMLSVIISGTKLEFISDEIILNITLSNSFKYFFVLWIINILMIICFN